MEYVYLTAVTCLSPIDSGVNNRLHNLLQRWTGLYFLPYCKSTKIATLVSQGLSGRDHKWYEVNVTIIQQSKNLIFRIQERWDLTAITGGFLCPYAIEMSFLNVPLSQQVLLNVWSDYLDSTYARALAVDQRSALVQEVLSNLFLNK